MVHKAHAALRSIDLDPLRIQGSGEAPSRAGQGHRLRSRRAHAKVHCQRHQSCRHNQGTTVPHTCPPTISYRTKGVALYRVSSNNVSGITCVLSFSSPRGPHASLSWAPPEELVPEMGSRQSFGLFTEIDHSPTGETLQKSRGNRKHTGGRSRGSIDNLETQQVTVDVDGQGLR